MSSPAVRIDVWSDYVCPFCYLAEPTLKRIEQEFGSKVQVAWRAFELRRTSAYAGSKRRLSARHLGPCRLPDGARAWHDAAPSRRCNRAVAWPTKPSLLPASTAKLPS